VTLSEAMDMTVPGFMSPAAIDARLLAPFRRAVGGTVAAARGALAHGLGINLGGGFHHARPAAGGGFCVYNDVAAALHALRADGWRGRALIVDTDAHQGDGNHAFFADDPQVFSLSLHQGGIFPVPKLHGDADITFDGGADDGELLAALEAALAPALEDFRPDLVFHVAGSDVLGDDPLAGLAMSVEGLVRRDLLVTGAVRGRGIPLVHLLAGGYGPSSARAQARSVAALLEHAARGAP
jgi:histone deacetylase 11